MMLEEMSASEERPAEEVKSVREERAEETVHDPQRLDAVRRTGLLDTPAEESFDRLTSLAAKLTGAPVTFISLVDEKRDFYKSCFGFPEPLASTRVVEGTTFCHFAMAAREPLLIEDTLADPVYRNVPTVESMGVRAYLGVPLVTAAGEVLGSFCAIDFKPRHWTPLDAEVMTELAASTLREIELRGALEAAREAQRRLHAEHQFLEATMRQMPAGVIVADMSGRVTFSNTQLADIIGGIPGNVLAERDTRAYRSDGTKYGSRDVPISRSILAGELVVNEEVTVVLADGAKRTILASSAPIRDAAGQVIAGVTTVYDITERERLVAQIAEGRRRLETLLEQVPAGVLVAEAPSGRIIMGNRQVEEILGDRYLVSRGVDSEAERTGFHDDGRPVQPHEWPLARAVRGEVIRGEELQYVHAEGRRVWVRIHAAPIRDSDGQITGGVAVFYDIDEQRRMQIENARLYEEAKSANQAKDDFFAAVSHELRTPMTSVIGWARLLRLEELNNPTAIEAAEAIESSAALQAQLVDDLLDVSRISQGKIVVRPETLLVGEVIDQAIRAAQPSAGSKGVRLRSNLTGVFTVNADRGRLRQVIGNLLSNAVKFTPSGGLIEVSSNRVGENIVIAVSDTGRGIPPDLLPFIFDRGRQAKSAELGGLGLGLAIVKHLVGLHGGTIRAESEGEGKGATFTVLLPAC